MSGIGKSIVVLYSLSALQSVMIAAFDPTANTVAMAATVCLCVAGNVIAQLEISALERKPEARF